VQTADTFRTGATFAAGLALLAGCADTARLVPVTTAPVSAPAPPPAPPQVRSDLALYFEWLENDRVERGLMRRDGGNPVSASQLALAYIDVALHDEYLRQPAGFTPRRTASVLRRWAQPVIYRLEFGASVDPQTAQADHAQVEALVARMSQAARHPMSVLPLGSPNRSNFHVLVVSEDERRALGPRLRVLVPGIEDVLIRLIENMPRETLCLAVAFSRDGGARYSEAVAIIRAEHPDLTRLACYHEELAQGLGLANDSPRARPSIFNDDQEFALITGHDLLLLRLHYDPRLTPGMTEAEARPLIFSIASELVGGSS
jgi:hypothetical protein